MFFSLFICRFTGTWCKKSGLNRCEVVQIAHLGWVWFYFFQIESFFLPTSPAVMFNFLSWQKIKVYRLTSTTWAWCYFLTITSVISRNICFVRLENFPDILFPSGSAHCHHRAKSSSQCPFDFIKKHQAASCIVSHFQKPLQRVFEATQLLDVTSEQKVRWRKHAGGTFNTGSSQNKQLTL